MFLGRILNKGHDGLFIELHTKNVKEDEEELRDSQVAPWLIFPEKSDFYKMWMFVLTATLQIELFCTPVVLVWP